MLRQNGQELTHGKAIHSQTEAHIKQLVLLCITRKVASIVRERASSSLNLCIRDTNFIKGLVTISITTTVCQTTYYFYKKTATIKHPQ